jgi:hypothetical protein
LNRKSSYYFPRKTYSNLARNLKFLNLRPFFRFFFIYDMKTAISRKTPFKKSRAYIMLILSIFLNKKSYKYFLRKTHFKLAIFEFAAVWSPLPLPLTL